MTCDIAVLGAGPAGMAAAATAAELGLRTVLIDEQPWPGGQIYRNVEGATAAAARVLGADYRDGEALVSRLRASGAKWIPGATVWDVAPNLRVSVLRDGAVSQLLPAQLIACTGAQERATPVPGWTLPGVMSAGSAQVALKAAGSVPGGRVVLAGAGPLLLLVAGQLIDAGTEVVAVIETAEAQQFLRAMRHLPRAAWCSHPELLKGLRMLARLRRARVAHHRAATDLRVLGDARASGLAFTVGGKRHEIAADLVLLHHGVVPNTQLTRLLRARHRWSDGQLAWQVVCDAHGLTSVARLRVAGDGAQILGAGAAEHTGTLAALGAAHELGRIDAARLRSLSAPHLRAVARARALRVFLDTLYRPPPAVLQPADDVIVCRCEEITAGRIREMARRGCRGPNQTKFFSRCGMGPCQGRLCGIPVTQILAASTGLSEDEVGAYRTRAPLKPIPLQALASVADAPSSVPPSLPSPRS
jgi:NADPH-dependent 2,4-dienoyl-CoA reductase/sulfur reductase-like enzyme